MSVFADHVEPLNITAITPDSRVIARFTIPGNPVPKQRPRLSKGHTYTPERTVIGERTVLTAFRTAYPNWIPVEHKVELTCKFFRGDRRAVDVDNLGKLVQDALNCQAFLDDSQVFDLHSSKWFTTKERARTEVVIELVLDNRVELIDTVTKEAA